MQAWTNTETETFWANTEISRRVNGWTNDIVRNAPLAVAIAELRKYLNQKYTNKNEAKRMNKAVDYRQIIQAWKIAA